MLTVQVTRIPVQGETLCGCFAFCPTSFELSPVPGTQKGNQSAPRNPVWAGSLAL